LIFKTEPIAKKILTSSGCYGNKVTDNFVVFTLSIAKKILPSPVSVALNNIKLRLIATRPNMHSIALSFYFITKFEN